MNDPSFDQTISGDAGTVVGREEADERDEVEEDEQGFLEPS
jgi:hypothetical protein